MLFLLYKLNSFPFNFIANNLILIEYIVIFSCNLTSVFSTYYAV